MATIFFRVIPVTFAVLLLAACSGSDVPSSVTGRDKERLEEAFARADEGKDPMTICAGLTGRAIGHASAGKPSKSASDAFEACYVDVRARYFHALLTRGPDKEACTKISTAAWMGRMSLGNLAKENGWDVAALDRRMADKVAARVGSACDASVMSVLRGE